MSTGSLVAYEHDGSPLVAVITGFARGKHQLLNMRGREVEMGGNRIHPLPAQMPAEKSSKEERIEHLLNLYETAHTRAAQVDLEEIWSFVQDEKEEVTNEELCELYYGKNQFSEHLALRLALLDDRIFFKRKKEKFIVRPAETVEELKKAEATRLKKIALQERTVEAFAARLQDASATIPEDLQHYLNLLMQIAAQKSGIDQGSHKEVKELMNLAGERLKLQLGGSPQERAYKLLRQLHLFHKNSNLSFIRHGLDQEYSEEELRQAEALSTPENFDSLPEEEKRSRRDCTTLDAITIDDFSTRDMDDALTVEELEQGFRFGIHISDVAALIPLDSELDLAAKARGTSIYCPELTANMFPNILAEDKISLVQDKPRRVVSCFFTTDRECNILSSEVALTLICVKQRFGYEEVDQHLQLQDNRTLNRLYDFAMSCEALRLADGALKIPKKIAQISLSDPEQLAEASLSLTEIDEHSPARSLIGEMMILANKAFCEFALERDLPLIFRSQEAPDPSGPDPTEGVPPGPAHDYAMRMNLKRSEISTEAAPHATLALAAYAQNTSPIRRYLDLCNQRQIVSALLEEAPAYSADQLLELITGVSDPLQRRGAMVKETRRFWLLRYLQKRSRQDRVITGTVLRTDLKNPLVELHEIFLPILVKTRSSVKRGDELKLRIVSIDPVFDYVKLEVE